MCLTNFDKYNKALDTTNDLYWHALAEQDQASVDHYVQCMSELIKARSRDSVFETTIAHPNYSYLEVTDA